MSMRDDSGGAWNEAGDGGGGSGVGQGGAQDFGLFRQILEDGGIPAPETIDDVGFFAEHVLDLPAPDCGADVCVHGMLGVMGNMLTGANCTMVLVGMNTPIDPSEIPRPPLNLALAIDVSGSMEGQSIQAVVRGLERMIPALQPDDRVTIVAFANEGEVVADYLAGADAGLAAAIDSLHAGGKTNIYDGLRQAFDIVAANEDAGRQNRVILLSDGVATAGITSPATIAGLAEQYAEEGIGLTTIGVGEEFDVQLMRTLAEQGAGSFYFLEDASAVEEVFVEEVEAFLLPLAERVEIDIDVGDGYDLRAVYGTKQAEIIGNTAIIDIPILQLAHRDSSSDNANGRRGGGGAMLVEVTPNGGAAADVGDLQFVYRDPVTGQAVDQSVSIDSPLSVGETPQDGYFADASVEKSFVMLNIYVAFRMASQRAVVGDDPGALAVLRSLLENAEAWVDDNPDDDIEDDLKYVRLFIQNIENRAGSENVPTPVPEPWPFD